jgi:hypothetical protein
MNRKGLFAPPTIETEAKSTEFLDVYKPRNELRVIMVTVRAEIQHWLNLDGHTEKIKLLEMLLNDDSFMTSPNFKLLPIYIQRTWSHPHNNLTNKTYTSENSVRDEMERLILEEIASKEESARTANGNANAVPRSNVEKQQEKPTITVSFQRKQC